MECEVVGRSGRKCLSFLNYELCGGPTVREEGECLVRKEKVELVSSRPCPPPSHNLAP